MKKLFLLLFLLGMFELSKAQKGDGNKTSVKEAIKKGECAEQKKMKKEMQKKSLTQPPVSLTADSAARKNNLNTKLKKVDE